MTNRETTLLENTGIDEIGEEIMADSYEAIGADLRAARTDRGLSLDEVAQELRFSKAYIRYLEDGTFDSLPGATYVSGYIRSYAQLLDLDASAMVGRYQSLQAPSDAKPAYNFPVNSQKPQRSGAVMASVAIIAAVIGYGGWYWANKPGLNSATPSTQNSAAEFAALKNNELNALNTDEFGEDDSLDVSAGGETAIVSTSSNETSAPSSDDTATESSENAVTDMAGNTVNQAVSDPAAPMAPLVDTNTATITASNAAGNADDADADADTNTGEEMPVLASADDTDTNVAQNNAVTTPLITETAPAVNSDDTAVLAETSNGSIGAISGSNDRMPNGGSAVATSRDPANEITIRAVASSWVEIVRNDGEEVMTKLMRSGDIYLIDSGESLYLSTGNAGGLEFVLNDGLVLSAGDVGEILRDLPLKPEGLINKL